MSKGRRSEEAEDETRDFIVEDEEVRGLVRGQIVPRPARRSPRGGADTFYGGLLQPPIAEQEDEFEDEVAEDQRLAVNWSGPNSPHHSSHTRREELPRLHHHLPHHIHTLQRPDPEESSSDIGMSLSMSDRLPNQSTASLLDSMERRTQRTYRYGIGLVCVGATLNWLGFAQGHGYVDPLRYLGVACVISGSFCVCLAMCRWLGRPISVSTHRVSGLTRLDYQDERTGRQNGDVHVINVSVPMYAPPMHEEYRPTKPPDYDAAVQGEPPPYDEAIKLDPGALFTKQPNSSTTTNTTSDNFFACGHPSPSHSTNLITTRPAGLALPTREAPVAGNLNTQTTVSLSSGLSSSNQDSGGTAFHGDCVVVVDASESANATLNAKLGAPPPYTKEYTPSPRHSISYPHPSLQDTNAIDNENQLNANQLSIVSSNSSNNNNNNLNNNIIVPTHSPHGPERQSSGNINASQIPSVSSLTSIAATIPAENLNLNNNINNNNIAIAISEA